MNEIVFWTKLWITNSNIFNTGYQIWNKYMPTNNKFNLNAHYSWFSKRIQCWFECWMLNVWVVFFQKNVEFRVIRKIWKVHAGRIGQRIRMHVVSVFMECSAFDFFQILSFIAVAALQVSSRRTLFAHATFTTFGRLAKSVPVAV